MALPSQDNMPISPVRQSAEIDSYIASRTYEEIKAYRDVLIKEVQLYKEEGITENPRIYTLRHLIHYLDSYLVRMKEAQPKGILSAGKPVDVQGLTAYYLNQDELSKVPTAKRSFWHKILRLFGFESSGNKEYQKYNRTSKNYTKTWKK